MERLVLQSISCFEMIRVSNSWLTHLFSMHPFSTPWKHQVFWCFQGVEKGCIENKSVKCSVTLFHIVLVLDAMNWERCQSIGKLIAHVPSQVGSVEEYFRIMWPQVKIFEYNIFSAFCGNADLVGLKYYYWSFKEQKKQSQNVKKYNCRLIVHVDKSSYSWYYFIAISEYFLTSFCFLKLQVQL